MSTVYSRRYGAKIPQDKVVEEPPALELGIDYATQGYEMLEVLDKALESQANKMFKPSTSIYYDDKFQKYGTMYQPKPQDRGIIRDMVAKPSDRFELTPEYKAHIKRNIDKADYTSDLDFFPKEREEIVARDLGPETYGKLQGKRAAGETIASSKNPQITEQGFIDNPWLTEVDEFGEVPILNDTPISPKASGFQPIEAAGQALKDTFIPQAGVAQGPLMQTAKAIANAGSLGSGGGMAGLFGQGAASQGLLAGMGPLGWTMMGLSLLKGLFK